MQIKHRKDEEEKNSRRRDKRGEMTEGRRRGEELKRKDRRVSRKTLFFQGLFVERERERDTDDFISFRSLPLIKRVAGG